jgi:hypothetical protein
VVGRRQGSAVSRYEALIHRSWRENGLSPVIVARIRSDGRADVGVFLNEPENLDIILGKNREGREGSEITDTVNTILHALRPLRRTTP